MKFRLTLTAQQEYEVNLEAYPKEIRNDPQKMLEVDIEAFQDDPMLFIDADNVTFRIRGEIVKEG